MKIINEYQKAVMVQNQPAMKLCVLAFLSNFGIADSTPLCRLTMLPADYLKGSAGR